MQITGIDGGGAFDFGKVSDAYAKYRDIYPDSLYKKLQSFGIGVPEQRILDLGSGTGVLPRRLYETGAQLTVTDIAEGQVETARRLAEEQGMRMNFCVCSAEKLPFADGSFDAVTAVQCFRYFDTARAMPEIYRVLRPGGIFCRVDMEWLPKEDEIAAQTEALVLQYNPAWTGGGFPGFRYQFPEWAEGTFELDTVHCYCEAITFTLEAWRGRIYTCRGVGASLPPETAKRFDTALADVLAPYRELHILHQLQIEQYRRT